VPATLSGLAEGSGVRRPNCTYSPGVTVAMPEASERLTPADPADLTAALAFALRFDDGSASARRMRPWPRLSPSVWSSTWNDRVS
jgi:hypothetical protein